MTEPIRQGCDYQQQNYYPFPKALVDQLMSKLTPSAFVLLHFVVRHTWGQLQEDSPATLVSLDEIISGRCQNGIRVSVGTGLSKATASVCLKQLEELGVIKIFIDVRDRGRAKRYYRLRMVGESAERCEVIFRKDSDDEI